MRAAPTDRAELTGLALVLLLAACPAHADRRTAHGRCTREDTESATAGGGALRAEISRPLPRPLALPAAAAPPPRPVLDVHFAPLTDLGHRMRPTLLHYSMLSLWDSPYMRIFLGLDHSGRAGLHLQQQDPREWSAPRAAIVRNERAPRSVPLSSQ